MKLGLIGKSIQYSLSPKIHTYWLNLYQLSGSYHLIDDDFDQIESLIKEGEFSGLNVTMPYKTKVLDLIPEWSSPLAAVNTLVFKNGELWSAKNTDFEAALEALNTKDQNRVIIFGAGGAAKAMIYAAQQAGFHQIHVCSRTPLEGSFQWHCWLERDKVLQDGGILINATSIKDDQLLSNWDNLTSLQEIIDLTYDLKCDPILTQQARQKGLKLMTGKEFLLAQAQKSFSYWTGITPQITSELLGLLA